MIFRHAHHKPLTVKFPDKCEWQISFKPHIREGLVWYTDGSKSIKGNGTGQHRRGLRKSHSFSLGLHNTVFQAKIYNIKACNMENREQGYTLHR